MSETVLHEKKSIRITCMTHSQLTKKVTAMLAERPAANVTVANARCVRQRMHVNAWMPSRKRVIMDDSPMDVFRLTVAPADAGELMNDLVQAADLRTPGHGMIYAQEVIQHGMAQPEGDRPTKLPRIPGMINGLALLTCIVSRVGSGDQIARTALKLGACVPVISRGIGTGIRDRLGLLRITIPPEKEIVRMIVPAEDAEGIRRIIVEEGRMERPGAGFLYQTGIAYGLVDPMINIGRREHAASMEQIIAALDEIKSGTAWRRRFSGLHERFRDSDRHVSGNHVEISFCCMEGQSGDLVHSAIAAGAGGATVELVRCLNCGQEEDGATAREIAVLCVAHSKRKAVIESLLAASPSIIPPGQIQTLPSPTVFSYGRGDA